MKKSVIAIRIYYVLNRLPMADLRMSDGTIHTIIWVDVADREKYVPLINGYTLIYDERSKCDWKEWL